MSHTPYRSPRQRIIVVDSYAELGATASSPEFDKNLGIAALVDDATSTDGTVQLNTIALSTNDNFLPARRQGTNAAPTP